MSVALNISESGLQPGVFWSGGLPSDWRVKRLKFVVRPVSAKAAYGESELPYMGLEHIESWTGRYLEDEDASPDGVVSHFVPGDVLFGKLRPYLAKVHLARHRGVCSTEALVLRADEELLPEYLRYFLVAPVTIEHINSSTYGSKMPRASWDFIGNQLQPVPPLKQQQKIAAFLDRKTAEIGTLIAKKRRLLDRLAEKRTALIARAVTKGLKPDTPMKDSGIEWLGVIPAHWEVCQLKRIWLTSDYGLSESIRNDHGVPVLRMSCIVNGRIDFDQAGLVEDVHEELLLKKDDLLFNRTNSLDQIAKVGRVDIDLDRPISFASYLVRIRANELALPIYLVHLLNSSPFLSFARANAIPAIGQANLKPSRYGQIHIPLPGREEQKKIVDAIEESASATRPLEDRILRSIQALKEQRSALITNAVTGQIKVT